MNHRDENEAQLVVAQREGFAILHLYHVISYAVEAFQHSQRLLVAHNLDVRVIFLDEGDGAAVVRFHVVDDKVIDFAVANHLVDVLQELGEEIHLYCINQRYLLIVNDIRVVTHSVRQRPEALKTMLIAVVNAYVINFVCNFCHIFYIFIIPSSLLLRIPSKHNCRCPCSIRWRIPGRSSGGCPIAPQTIRSRCPRG